MIVLFWFSDFHKVRNCFYDCSFLGDGNFSDFHIVEHDVSFEDFLEFDAFLIYYPMVEISATFLHCMDNPYSVKLKNLWNFFVFISICGRLMLTYRQRIIERKQLQQNFGSIAEPKQAAIFIQHIESMMMFFGCKSLVWKCMNSHCRPTVTADAKKGL